MLRKLKQVLLFDKHTCPWWLAYAWDNRIRETFHDTDRILKPYLSKGATALDVGCGMGYFSLHMARYVGGEGTVIAVDIQTEMLEIVSRRARKSGLQGIIRPVLSRGDVSGVGDRVDFALSFWMLHEVSDRKCLVEQIVGLLKPGGTYLIAEPKIHTGRSYFRSVVALCENTGLRVVDFPAIWFSRAVVLTKQ